MGSEELIQALRRLARRARRRRAAGPGVDATPGCAFGAVVEARLRYLEKGLDEVKSRLTGLLLVVAGAAAAELIRHWLG